MKKIKREISLKELKDTVIMDRNEYHKLIYDMINTNRKLSDIRRLFYNFKSNGIGFNEINEFIDKLDKLLRW